MQSNTVRQKKDDFFITIKGNKTGISRFEFEYKISKKVRINYLKVLILKHN